MNESSSSGAASAPGNVRADTVDALLETVRDFLKAEDSRTQSLVGRGSGLAGFSGLVVSLSGLIARDLIGTSSETWVRYVASAFLGAALVLLVATIVVVVLGILWPRSYDTIAMEEIERYPYPEFVCEEKVMIQGRTMRGLVTALASERKRNARKARWLKWAYGLLMVGLISVSAAVGTLVVEALV
jgi:hypothetical protein